MIPKVVPTAMAALLLPTPASLLSELPSPPPPFPGIVVPEGWIGFPEGRVCVGELGWLPGDDCDGVAVEVAIGRENVDRKAAEDELKI